MQCYVSMTAADVTSRSIPAACSGTKIGSALRFDGNGTCVSIGMYSKWRDDTYYSLIDATDPSKGISMKYLYGSVCDSGQLSTATIQIQCANVKYEVVSAQEPSSCSHEIVMKSQYGCPTVS